MLAFTYFFFLKIGKKIKKPFHKIKKGPSIAFEVKLHIMKKDVLKKY